MLRYEFINVIDDPKQIKFKIYVQPRLMYLMQDALFRYGVAFEEVSDYFLSISINGLWEDGEKENIIKYLIDKMGNQHE